MAIRQFFVFSVPLIALLWGALAPSAAQDEIKPFGRRIVGGEPTTIKEHPWQAALNITIDGQTYLCGGSSRWVLTAAHCFKRTIRPSEVKVKAGVTKYVTEGAWLDIEQVVIHEAYNPSTQENDLALIKLRTPPEGKVIPLASSKSAIPLGQPLEVTGWGATSEEGGASKGLLKASVPYVANATCNGPSAYNGAIKPGMMCAGFRDGGIDSCQGDSGGPLVWRTSEGPVLVGVVSWGEGCARKLKYGVYTRAASYADWIGQVIAHNGR
jgi:trypsin